MVLLGAFLRLPLLVLSANAILARLAEDGDNSTLRRVDDGATEFASANNTGRIDGGDALSRGRRTLVFPGASDLLLIFGLGTPLQLDRESVIIGFFTKIIYTLPDNATYFTDPGVYYARSSRSRWSVYRTLETAAELYGFGGKSCLLRAVCEAASVPFDRDHGLVGQLIQTFLTPSSTDESHDEYADRDYHAAERQGRDVGDNCRLLYPECKRSILDVFSAVAADA